MKRFEDFGIDLLGKTGVEVKTVCPKCSAQRKKKKYPCLSVNTDKGLWHCWHCEWSGSLSAGEDRRPDIRPMKTYRKPEYKCDFLLEPKVIEWFQGRGIEEPVLARSRIGFGPVYMPQLGEETAAIQFPYYRGDEVVNIKYRDAQKNFRMVAGAERILYGMNDILPDSVIIVEGEMDKLSVAQAGFWSCVSVPDGAPSPNTRDYSGKFEFLVEAKERLDPVKRFVLAVDSDAPGRVLEEELARRLGRERCFRVEWPEDCKDANDVLVKLGAHVLADCIRDAAPYPLKGVFEFTDISSKVRHIYEHGMPATEKTGWASLDPFYSVRAGEMSVVTGIPGHGKSEWLDALMVNLAKGSGWRFGVFSPENQPLELHAAKLAEKAKGKPFAEHQKNRMTGDELDDTLKWLNDRIAFILPEEPTLEAILTLAKALVYRNGIRGLVIDPWNEIEHARPERMSETEYVSQSLSKIRTFGRQNGVHVWIVAHPTKLIKGKDDMYPVPTPYDITGSAHWRNKADNCLAVWRDFEPSNRMVEVHVQKIRFKDVGRAGHKADLVYYSPTGQYFDNEDAPQEVAYTYG